MAGSTYLQDSLSPPCITWWNTTQVCTDDVMLFFCLNIPDKSKKSNIKMLAPFPESADGLCCRLTGPCFIKGFDNSREAKPIPTTVRRPTINWKNISRCGRFSLFLPLLTTATGGHSIRVVVVK